MTNIALNRKDISLDLVENQLLSPSELADLIPLKPDDEDFICRARKTIEKILTGKDERLLLIVGPCSIHDVNAAYDYALKLADLSKKVSSHIFVVMRAYFEKARTTYDWKGLIYDPHLDGRCDMSYGLHLSRKFLVSLPKMGLACASEILGFATFPYFSDLLSWGCIGARTSSSQPHREVASSLPFPIGFKNTTEGNLIPALHGILSARGSHGFMGIDRVGRLCQYVSDGNPYGHLVLRGGEKKSNYDAESLSYACQLLNNSRISTRLLVDCAHDNCQKDPQKQIHAFEAVLSTENKNIAGLMLESFLEEGTQPLSQNARYGVSITDPCLSWESTKYLIEKAFFRLKSSH